MNNEQCVGCNDHHSCDLKSVCGARCISWSAILVGALVAVGLSFLLNVFSMAIGLTAYRLGPDGNYALAMGGIIGLTIGSIIAMFFAGWVAGLLGRTKCVSQGCGGLYGFTTWCLALVLAVILTSHVGRFVAVSSSSMTNPDYVAVHMTHNNAAPTVSTDRDNTPTVNPEKAAAVGTFALFVLFLLGALACTYGGHCGMKACCKRKDGTPVV